MNWKVGCRLPPYETSFVCTEKRKFFNMSHVYTWSRYNEYMYVRKYSLPISSLLSGLFDNAESLMTRSVRVRKIRV